ncbi:hypothetical protein GXM_04068 [Nostoc sphaeroides CCNUC1]|uniref:Uncharacterized protein n=1 Tax=Nostoc sphaeroides CCNUC1 TaxID=2653204 RepID=A0A5P8W1I4_9NOSO|nr:hypothetical protein GXM_04068 [Nostoc sphaeroides CCNUC1]
MGHGAWALFILPVPSPQSPVPSPQSPVPSLLNSQSQCQP